MDEKEFWRTARGRLMAEERTLAWLARHLRISRQLLNQYVHQRYRTPPEIMQKTASMLGLRIADGEEHAA